MQLLKLGQHNLADYLSIPSIKVDLDTEEKCARLEQVFGIERIAFAEELFPIIDPSFLSIPHPDGYTGSFIGYYGDHYRPISGISGLDHIQVPFKLSLPRFAVYNPHSPYCRLDSEITYSGIELEVLDQELSKPMLDALRKALKIEYKEKALISLKRRRESSKPPRLERNNFQFTSTFKGIIPEKVKRTIQSARSVFDAQIYIVAEAENWDGKVIPIEDPLVVGSLDNKTYLIDQFNCTPLEDYFRREFVKPANARIN